MKIVKIVLILKVEDNVKPEEWNWITDLDISPDEVLDTSVRTIYESPKKEE